jgi:hypothetical protein
MLRRTLLPLFLASLPVSALTLNLDGLRMDLDVPEGTESYAHGSGQVLLLRSGDEVLGAVYVYSSGRLGYRLEDIVTFYGGDTNAFLGDMLADLRRAISEGDRDPAFRWGGYNRTSAKGIPVASADYFNFGYYNLDSLFLFGENLVHVDCYCRAEREEDFRELVLVTLASLEEHEGW